MGYFNQLQALFVIGSVLGLLLLGLFLALRSGDDRVASPRGARLVLSSLSQVLIRVFGLLVGLLAVQQFVGFPIGLVW